MSLPTVWFERPVLPEMADEVASIVSPVVPSDLDADPYEHLSSAIGAVVGVLQFDATVMDGAPDLVVIARTGIGYDSVDLDAASARAIAVCNAPDGPTVSTAEHAVTLALSAAKSIGASTRRLRDGEADLYQRHVAFEFDGKTLGLLGVGRIGRRVAQIARGFGMRVIAHDPFVADPPEGVEMLAAPSDVLAAADVLSVHVPMSAATARMCDADFFAQMKPSAVFVNTARGGLVDQDALLAAVESGHLAAAALDVTDPEPLPPDDPLLDHERITVTPHVAAGTTEARYGNFAGAFEGVRSIVEGTRPEHLVNAEAWDAIEARLKERE